MLAWMMDRYRQETHTNALHNLLNLERGEGRLTLILGILLFGNSMSIQMSSVVAISGFLSTDGLDNFLVVLLIDMVIILVATGFQSYIIDRIDRVTLLRRVTLTFAITFAILYVVRNLAGPSQIYYGILYILSEQQLLFFPLVIWALAGDLFNTAQSKRVVPVVNSLRFVGRIVGLGIVTVIAWLSQYTGIRAKEVLVVDVLFYLLAYGLVRYGLKDVKPLRAPAKPVPVRETLTDGWKFVRDVPIFRSLALIVLFLSATDILIEFRFLGVADATFTELHDYQSFFSLFRIGVALLCFTFSGVFFSRLLARIHLKNSFFLLPVVIIVSALLLLGIPGITSAALAMGMMQITRDSAYESSQRALFSLVPNALRGRVSMFIDSYLMALGTIMGVVFTGLIILILGPEKRPIAFHYYLSFVIAVAIGALLIAWRLRRVYDVDMLNWRLRRRKWGNNALLDRLHL